MFFILIALSTSLISNAAPPKETTVYFGTYARGEESGIYQSRLDLRTGQLSDPVLAAPAVRPGFLVPHPNGKYLYSVGEKPGYTGKDADSLCAFEIAPDTGKLTFLNSRPGGGNEPCQVSMDAEGRHLFSAQYGGGSCSVYPIAPDGSLSPRSSFHQHRGASKVDQKRQMDPHAHSINLDPSNRFAMVVDLGKDQVLIYRFDAESGTLTPNEPAYVETAPGGGPRHFDFHPSGKFAYVNLEMASKTTAFDFDETSGALTPKQTVSTLPPDFAGKSSGAEIRVSDDGRFLYASNRGHDSIAIFSIDQDTGELAALGHESTGGKTPRHFNIDPSGKFLIVANQNSNSATVFAIDPATGRLSHTGNTVKVPKPVCVVFSSL